MTAVRSFENLRQGLADRIQRGCARESAIISGIIALLGSRVEKAARRIVR
jgi:hypothetical protein